jgi:hypothetical protein
MFIAATAAFNLIILFHDLSSKDAVNDKGEEKPE